MIIGVLNDLQDLLEFLIKTAKMHQSASTSRSASSNSVVEALVYIKSRNHIWKQWVDNYNERTKLMMNLFFSIASQLDSRTNLDIANLTSKIAVETQRDSSSMITIAAVTMLFLPGTFVSVSSYAPFISAKGASSLLKNSIPGNLQHGLLQHRYR